MKKTFLPSYAKFCLLVIITFSIIGCGQNAKWSEVANKSHEIDPTNTFPEKYNEYLLIMDKSQRARFFKLDTDLDRDRFLQEEGIFQHKYLNDHLQVGMSPQKVVRLLGPPMNNEVYMRTGAKTTEWTYSTFNGYRNVSYVIVFHNDQVAEWKVWVP